MQTNHGSSPVIEVLRDAWLRIHVPICAERLWQRHLTERDRQTLGGDLKIAFAKHGGTAGMWARLRGVSLERAVIEVAKRLNFLPEGDAQWLLREIGEPADAEEAMERAIAAGHLVLVEQPREAYWNGEKIEIDWNRQNKAWDLLLQLAQRAKAQKPVDRLDIDQTGKDPNVVVKRTSRLKNLPGFPIDLADLIEPVGRGTQQLMLPPERIRLFEMSTDCELREWQPW